MTKEGLHAYEMMEHAKYNVGERFSNETRRQRMDWKEFSVSHNVHNSLSLLGHICRVRDDRLAKKALLGSVDGEEDPRRGGQTTSLTALN